MLFRERFTRHGTLLRWLSPNAYALYAIHIWPIVALQFALASSTIAPFAKFASVALLRWLPYASKVL